MTKNTKTSKPRLVAKRTAKGTRKLVRISGSDKKPPKQLPDTSQIPWFPSLPKTGTDA